MTRHPQPRIVGDSILAHRVYVTDAEDKKKFHNATAVCGVEGIIRVPCDEAGLCAKCFRHDKRTVAEWVAANQREKATATADSLFKVFGMKRAQK